MANYRLGDRRKKQRNRRSRLDAYGNIRAGILASSNLNQLRTAVAIVFDYAAMLEFKMQRLQRRIDDD